jgi:N-methylhydantoinase A
MHSAGGTLSVEEAQRSAAKLVLSGPAGGVMGAALVAAAAGFADVITYDMGGTSTDVATILDGKPQWTTSSTVDGLPIGLPAFDIHTVGAGGGSVAFLDTGGALRVGPRSAGAVPGPACYGHGGTEPTVTDANLVLGRILPDQFAGGSMRVYPKLAQKAIEPLAQAMAKSVVEAALGILRVAENNMAHAIRAVTSRRGLDPRRFVLLSFGGAGGLHACALADGLEIPRVLVPPYCGVLSALGMVVTPRVADGSKTVVHLRDQIDDARLAAEFGGLSGQTMDAIPYDQTASVEAHADVRFRGQSYELKVRVQRPTLEHIRDEFLRAYVQAYGQAPAGREIEIVTLRVRRTARHEVLELPKLDANASSPVVAQLVDETGESRPVSVLARPALLASGRTPGPLLLIDPHATTYVPHGWEAEAADNGSVVLTRC